MLHVSKIYTIVERATREKGRIPFNCTYVKKDGSIAEYKNVICLSSHFRPATINIQLTDNKVRKLRCICVLEINGIEIFT